MSLAISNKKATRIFLFAVAIGITLIYLLCDYYLRSVGHELLSNWVRAEAVSIQEGNLLTSSTKNQRVLLSSDYIRAVKLVKIENGELRERLHFGSTFDIEVKDIPEMHSEVVISRTGFLHSRAFYKIPNREGMFIIFDVSSNALNFVFITVSVLLLLMVIALISIIRLVERQEYLKREEIFKQANQSKILLGEIASRVGHDIMGLVRNIEVLAKRTKGLNEKQTEWFNESINKIKLIASDISKHTKSAIIESEVKLENTNFDIIQLLEHLIEQKRIQFEEKVNLFLNSQIEIGLINHIDPIELERAVSNLVNNAIEASSIDSEVVLELKPCGGFIELSIKDLGTGIPQENINKIGTRGFTYGKEMGTGIGAYYAKRFVESIGGRFKIVSEEGKGTTVRLFLPSDRLQKSEFDFV